MSDPQSPSDSATAPPAQVSAERDPLGQLYHMSTTAGLTAGAQEYVAINPAAVAALILGFGSVLVFLANVLLVIPLAGLICGIIAAVQVRRSNQTQSGMALAIGGILLSLGLGGGRLGYQILGHYHASADEQQIVQLMQQFGQELGAEHYQQAYDLCSERFRERVGFPKFEGEFSSWRTLNTTGPIQSITWNNEPMIFEDQNATTFVTAMALFKVQQDPQPRRALMLFEKIEGVWRVSDIPALFPAPRK